MDTVDHTPFAELPQALVEEMLANSESVGRSLYESFKKLREDKAKIRGDLQNHSLLKNEGEFGYAEIPTTCAADGSYGVERLLALDFAACAAVAVEGLTPPSEKREWERPHHQVFIHPEKHSAETGTIIRGIMMQMELGLAAKAPHDIVFLDGSFTTPLIYVNQAINKVSTSDPGPAGTTLRKNFADFLSSYKTVLESSRTDRLWVSMPKYTTKREIGKKLGWQKSYDDRAVLTGVLSPGECTSPEPLEKPNEPWHLRLPSEAKEYKDVRTEVLTAIDGLFVMYYKPHAWTPAFRIELASPIATNHSRLAVLLQGLKYQSRTPGVMEPYPLYMADRMVKHLHRAIPALRQTATTQITKDYEGDVGEVFFSMHGYRTDSGR
ncbi:MAG: DNA double-strand break repair nuclease NurA [Planctomycetota bacterium]|jgi:hypothetical protein